MKKRAYLKITSFSWYFGVHLRFFLPHPRSGPVHILTVDRGENIPQGRVGTFSYIRIVFSYLMDFTRGKWHVLFMVFRSFLKITSFAHDILEFTWGSSSHTRGQPLSTYLRWVGERTHHKDELELFHTLGSFIPYGFHAGKITSSVRDNQSFLEARPPTPEVRSCPY